MKRIVYAGLRLSQAHRIARRRLRNEVIMLGYHGFRSEPVDPVANTGGKHLAAASLARQLQHLARHHHVLRLEEFLELCERGAAAPPRSVVLTIDDGYRSVYRHAFPILKAFGIPATLFVATDFVERGRPLWTDRIDFCLGQAAPRQLAVPINGGSLTVDLTTPAGRIAASRALYRCLVPVHPDEQVAVAAALEGLTGVALGSNGNLPEVFEPASWAEIAEMQASGLVSIGSHTETYAIVARCEPERRRRELEKSKATIETRLSGSCRLFCYPNGERDDYDDDVKRLLREVGFRCALTTVAGTNRPATDPYELRRFIVSDHENFSGFLLKMYGVVHRMGELKRRVRREPLQ